MLLKDADGRVLGIAASMQDVTARWERDKALRARLAEMEAKLKQAGVLAEERSEKPVVKVRIRRSTPNSPDFVIPSQARDLQSTARCRSLASLGMTIHKKLLVPLRARLSPKLLGHRGTC